MKDIPLAEQLNLTPAQNAKRMMALVEKMKEDNPSASVLAERKRMVRVARGIIRDKKRKAGTASCVHIWDEPYRVGEIRTCINCHGKQTN